MDESNNTPGDLSTRSSNAITVPFLPFYGQPKRVRSAQSSTLCGTGTPQSLRLDASPIDSKPLQLPDLTRMSDGVASDCGVGAEPSPRIERSSVDAIGSMYASVDSKRSSPPPACGRLYEFRYPPMPRFNSTYKEAKKAEYDGDYEKAMTLYLRAIEVNDRPDSAMKDYAGILHMRGRTDEAILFLEQRGDRLKNSLGYKNLLSQLKAFLQTSDSEKRNLPRFVYVSIGEGVNTRLSFSTFPSIFPNYLKISTITFVNPFMDDQGSPYSSKAVLEFASHSAARKALMVVKHFSIKCQWLPDGLLDSDDRIVTVAGKDVSLEAIGPIVSVTYAIVSDAIVDTEWPPKLAGRSGDCHRSTSNPLTLPIITRVDSPPATPTRIKHLELDIGVVDATSRSSPGTIDWCLNTPSPVRHVALLF